MFPNRRQPVLGNVNLGNLSTPPSLEDIRFVLEQATRYRTRFVEVSWVVGASGVNFQLTCKILPTQPDPSWMLYRGPTGNQELAWGHSSSDLTLMHNLVMLECEKLPDAMSANPNAISSNAMDSMMTNNTSAGSMARAGDTLQSVPSVSSKPASSARTSHSSLNPVGNPTPPATTQFAGADPASAWLRNLDQSPEAYSSKTAPASSFAEPAQPQAPRYVAPVQVQGMEVQGDAKAVLLDGSLSNVAVPNLLRYIQENRLTGRLALQTGFGAAEIFFKSGDLKHAATLDGKGENALYEIATWNQGDFQFNFDEQTNQLSLAFETSVLISNCQRMLEYSVFLNNAGLRPTSYLFQSDPVNRAEFEGKLNRTGVPCDMLQQWRFYDAITGNLTLSEILRLCPLMRSEWTPILYNLVRLRYVQLADRPATQLPGEFLEAATLDQAVIDKFMGAATYPGTGLLAKGLFLWLLQQGSYRFDRSGTRFALVIFSVSSSSMLDGSEQPLEPEVMAEACRRVLGSKRKLDVVGHFDDDYAMLLPETDAAGAAVFANRIIRLWRKPALSPAFESSTTSLVASFGIASLPEDVRDLGSLIAAARVAKKKSKMVGAPVVLYHE